VFVVTVLLESFKQIPEEVFVVTALLERMD
jgi:hypothetical protein